MENLLCDGSEESPTPAPNTLSDDRVHIAAQMALGEGFGLTPEEIAGGASPMKARF